LDLAKLKELIELLEASELCELEIEEDGLRVRLQKSSPAGIVHAPYPVVGAPAHLGAGLAQPAVGAETPAAIEDDGLLTIDSPMVGVFYAAPAPGEPPFVNVGDTVAEGQAVCIIEAMKLMNEVAAKQGAVVERILVENGEPVEFNQPLFAIRPLDQA
jgi:acetyl-CoA carboxylase biotin carboxyl carrier protein